MLEANSASRSKRTPLVTKKTGMKTPKPTAASFCRNSGMGHRLGRVEVVEDRAGGERAQDQLEPELLGERDHPDQQHERAADPDLGAGVLQADQRRRDPPRALRLAHADRDRGDREHEEPDQDQLRADPARLAREQQGQQQHRGEVGDRGGGDHQLAEARARSRRSPGAPGRSPRARSRRG